MPGQFSSDMFRVADEQIPAVRAAVEESITELGILLARLERDGVIEPWLGDPVSENVVQQYSMRVMGAGGGSAAAGAPGSAYGALKSYEAELIRLKEGLDLTDRGYVRTDGHVTAEYRSA